jgi:ribosomal protein L37AE/L43A
MMAIKSRTKRAHAARMAKLKTEGTAIVAKGVCPTCGRPLRRNSSIAGWWVCEQRGAVGFRDEASLPSCSFDVIVPQ